MTRKIYAIGDIHADLDTLSAFSDYVKNREKEEAYIAVNGDLLENQFNLDNWLLCFIFEPDRLLENMEKFTNSQFARTKDILDNTELPYYMVHGNYEPPQETGDFFGEAFIHDRQTKLNGNTMYGQGGANVFTIPTHIARIWRPIDYEPEKIKENILQDDSDYLLLHNPLSGLLDRTRNGFVGVDITDVLEEHPYKVVFSGHVHGEGPLGGIQKGIHSGVAMHVNSDGKKTFAVNPGNLGKTGRYHPLTFELMSPDPYFGLFSEIELDDNGDPISLSQYSLAPEGELIDTPLKIAEFDLTKAQNLSPGVYFPEHLEKIPGFVVNSRIQPGRGMSINPAQERYNAPPSKKIDLEEIFEKIDIEKEFRHFKQDESIPQETKEQFQSLEEFKEFYKTDFKRELENIFNQDLD